jgi:hypothetical protein
MIMSPAVNEDEKNKKREKEWESMKKGERPGYKVLEEFVNS